MSMMWPRRRGKMVSTPSLLRASATSRPPETILGSVPLRWRVSSAGLAVLAGAGAAIGLPPGLFSCSLCRDVSGEVHVALDVVTEPQCVIAYEPFGAFRVPRLQRLHDLLVVGDGAFGAVLLEDRPLAHG